MQTHPGAFQSVEKASQSFAAAGVSLLAPDAASAEALFQTNSTLTRCRTEIEQA